MSSYLLFRGDRRGVRVLSHLAPCFGTWHVSPLSSVRLGICEQLGRRTRSQNKGLDLGLSVPHSCMDSEDLDYSVWIKFELNWMGHCIVGYCTMLSLRVCWKFHRVLIPSVLVHYNKINKRQLCVCVCHYISDMFTVPFRRWTYKNDMWRSFKRLNICKALGPDGIPGHVLRACAFQLASVFTYIVYRHCLWFPHTSK